MALTIEEAKEVIFSQTRIICELEKEKSSAETSEKLYTNMYREERQKNEALQTRIKELENAIKNNLSHTDEL